MKKILGKTFALLIVPALAFSQTAENFSDNNIDYPSFEIADDFNPEDYTLPTLDLEDDDEEMETIATVPTVDDILPSVNPAESYVLTSSSGNGLDTYSDKDLEVPSRSITIAQNQYVDVEYPGKGWLYLGETDNTTFLRYFGHTLTNDTVFTLRAKTQGKAVLHFYKIDSLTGNTINDYLEVIITGKTSSEEHVLAPSYGQIVPKGQGLKPSIQEIDLDESDFENDLWEADTDLSTSVLEEFQKTEAESQPEQTIQDISTVVDERIEKETSTPIKSNTNVSTATKNESKSRTSSSQGTSTSTESVSKASGSSSASTEKTSSPSSSSKSTQSPAPSSSPSAGQGPSVASKESSKDTSVPSSSTASSSTPTVKNNVPKVSSSKKQVITSAADDELLAKAQKEYNSKDYGQCLETLTEFFNNAITRIDEGLFLQGQALEANSPSRNIKAALDTYETLVKRYPHSKKWKAANERVIYIKRFYFNIR